jgi:hypothetical protein
LELVALLGLVRMRRSPALWIGVAHTAHLMIHHIFVKAIDRLAIDRLPDP